MGLTIDPWSFPDAKYEPTSEGEKVIVLGGGCFWCIEAVFKALDGVTVVRPGYAVGTASKANYKTVSSGRTHHAEVVEVVYDSSRLGLGALLKVFFAIAHDPTQVDSQGAEVGRQYRSVIFSTDERRRQVAEASREPIESAGVFDAPLATELVPLEAFYEAEGSHPDYAARNPGTPSLRVVAPPKLNKRRHYQEHLQEEEAR